MIYNHTTIKQLSAANPGSTIKDYLALSPQNDPFYTGTPADLAKAQWFTDIYNRAGYNVLNTPHLRRVHYWTVSQANPVIKPDGFPYENTQNCWDYLLSASSAARYLGLVPFEGIKDNKNPTPHQHAAYTSEELSFYVSVPELDDPYISVDGLNNANVQPYHLEIWCEKSTMNDILLPICERYLANLVTFEGEVSITSVCVSLMNRIRKSGYKPTRIFYISDFDPAGNSMPVAMSRKLEYALQSVSVDVDAKVSVLALTAEQVKRYKLPRIPIKDTEKRAASFERANGTGAAELDALEAIHEGVLGEIVRDAIKPYYSFDAENAISRAQYAFRQAVSAKVDAIVGKYTAEIEALKDMQDELNAIEMDANPYDVERYEPHVNERDNWLFDSQREYVAQIARYKQHKGA